MRKEENVDDSTNIEWGEVIELDSIAKASRGAEAHFEDGLLAALEETFNAKPPKAIALTRLAVLETDFSGPKAKEEYDNRKQSIGQDVRKHVSRLVTLGRLPHGTKCSINWHPITGVPQVSQR